jgi:hypothetical protein
MQPVAIALFAVAVVMIVIAAVLWMNTETFLRHAVRTTGTIIRIERRSDWNSDGNTTNYHPVFSYETPDGERVKTSSIGSSPCPFRVNQSIQVLYDPALPDSARIQSWFQIWGGPLICLGVGIAFAITALIFAHVPAT